MPLCGICGKNQASTKCINLQCGICCSGGGCNKHKNKSKNGTGNNEAASCSSSRVVATDSSGGKRKARSSASTPYMDDSGTLKSPRQNKAHQRRYQEPSPSRSPLKRLCDELEDAFDEVSHRLRADTPKEERYKVIRRVLIDHILKKRRKKKNSNYPIIDLEGFREDSPSSYSQSYANNGPNGAEDCRKMAEQIRLYGHNSETGGAYGPPTIRDMAVLINPLSTNRRCGYASTDVWADMQREDPHPNEDDETIEKDYDSDGSYICEWQYIEKNECWEVLKVFLQARISHRVDPPLVQFARSGNKEMVLALLGEGGEIDACLKWEETCWTPSGGHDEFGFRRFDEITQSWYGDTALMACAREGDEDLVSLLLRLGADHRHSCCYDCEHHQDHGVADAARRYGKTKTAALILEYVKENGNKINFPGLSLFGLAAAALPSYTGVPDSLLDRAAMARAEIMAAREYSVSRWKTIFAPTSLDNV